MKNSTGRKLLEDRYGKGCFMERAGIRKITPEEEKQMSKTIKGFKKLNRQMTYHHIKEKQYGGEVSIENGANLAEYNHAWLHSQPDDVKSVINEQLQQFKLNLDAARIVIEDKTLSIDACEVNLDLSDYISITAYDNTEQDLIKRKQKFNRAETKRETIKMIDEELYDR